ncbi:MAG: pentapeptide repeat-containing protein [Waterburya sp.]
MKITSEEFFRHYANGERDFFGIELRNADLSRADWKDDNPIGQTITGVNFSEGDLSGTDFRSNDMRACAFSGSKLVGCRFDGADLTKGYFSDADLSNSSFVGTKLTRANFSEANLTGVDFTGADLTDAKISSTAVEVVWNESVIVQNWVRQTVQYYRKIDFFEQYSALSDEELANTLKRLCLKEAYITGGNFEGRGDWEVIRFDRKRILEVSLDGLYGDDPGEYSFEYGIKTLQAWSKISRGTFQPTNFRDVDEHIVELTLNDMQHTVDPFEDPHGLAPQINSLIAVKGYQFEAWDVYPDCLVTVLTAEEKQQLQSERGWSFY